VGRVAFVVPWGAVWSLPIYELALMTAAYLTERELDHVDLVLVTPEDEPLQLFGRAGSEAVRALLDERGIAVQTGACAVGLVDGELRLVPEGRVAADRVVALPRLRGPRIDGLPQTVEGFIPVDAHSQVHGLSDLFAAGDITSFPVKQGGIATQVGLAAFHAAESATYATYATSVRKPAPDAALAPLRRLPVAYATWRRRPPHARSFAAQGSGRFSSCSVNRGCWSQARRQRYRIECLLYGS
jgi:sulfide:quinone oxidoreductase